MKTILATIALAYFSASLLSCVSHKKYVAIQDKAVETQKSNVELTNNLKKLEDSVASLSTDQQELAYELYKTSSELNVAKEYLVNQKLRILQMQSFIKAQKKLQEDLKYKIAGALVGFNAKELSVAMKNGRIYVSLQDVLLFPSGSATVTSRGREALAKLAEVLNASPQIKVDIEGHTDNMPIKTAEFADNWALSTARATAIARILIDDYHVEPAKLIASGRSSHDPIASNGTAAGRSQNRRTEVILAPKFDELMQIMNPTVYK